MELFGRVKEAFDPAGVLNPGVLVRPRPLDADIRVRPAPRAAGAEPLAGRGRLGAGLRRTTAATSPPPCTAAPAWASAWPARPGTEPGHVPVLPGHQGREGLHPRAGPGSCRRWSTARVVTGGWRAPEVREALDLCLSCKACSAECPAGVDMAAYKAEVLHQAYRGRLRPRSHYALGQLPRWARLASRVPGLANAALGRRRAWAGRPGWRRASTRAARCRRSRPSRSAPGTGGRRAAGGRPAPRPGPRRCCCSWTPSPTTSPRRSARPRSGCWPTPGSA